MAVAEVPVSPVAPKAKRRKTTGSASAHLVCLTNILPIFDTDMYCLKNANDVEMQDAHNTDSISAPGPA